MGLMKVECQSCKATMGVLEEWAGQKGRCPRCGTEYIMPGPGTEDLGEYRYDAFISYRHVKPDERVGEVAAQGNRDISRAKEPGA